jgi:hypothetical protein
LALKEARARVIDFVAAPPPADRQRLPPTFGAILVRLIKSG